MEQLTFKARQAGKALRRSKRLKLVFPVEVILLEGESEARREFAEMLSVNAHGGLLMLAASVQKGQTLRLVNRHTHEEQDCRVMNVGAAKSGKSAIGIEFVGAASNFWQISFPPVVPRVSMQAQN